MAPDNSDDEARLAVEAFGTALQARATAAAGKRRPKRSRPEDGTDLGRRSAPGLGDGSVPGQGDAGAGTSSKAARGNSAAAEAGGEVAGGSGAAADAASGAEGNDGTEDVGVPPPPALMAQLAALLRDAEQKRAHWEAAVSEAKARRDRRGSEKLALLLEAIFKQQQRTQRTVEQQQDQLQEQGGTLKDVVAQHGKVLEMLARMQMEGKGGQGGEQAAEATAAPGGSGGTAGGGGGFTWGEVLALLGRAAEALI
ncbi:hypothetical protein OEZ85_013778 [Tetradesmus obliquus]|uniref:Uncharacterized protein n=1 Tax=Tetradesmus obliquus TaxID=3088 RepID=A0ABY8U6E6_TETOB|nr:hypothetical protein OEZ85_013778 [Tetradesmus obliquus]